MKKTEAKPDRRVQRTQRTLRKHSSSSFCSMAGTRSACSTSASAPTSGASPLDTHFADKEELLLSGFDGLKRAIRASEAQAYAGRNERILGFAGPLMQHASENLRTFRALVGKRSGQALLKRFRQIVLELVSEDLARLGLSIARTSGAAHFLSGAFLELLIWWIDTRTTLSPAELENYFHELSAPVVAISTMELGTARSALHQALHLGR